MPELMERLLLSWAFCLSFSSTCLPIYYNSYLFSSWIIFTFSPIWFSSPPSSAWSYVWLGFLNFVLVCSLLFLFSSCCCIFISLFRSLISRIRTTFSFMILLFSCS